MYVSRKRQCHITISLMIIHISEEEEKNNNSFCYSTYFHSQPSSLHTYQPNNKKKLVNDGYIIYKFFFFIYKYIYTSFFFRIWIHSHTPSSLHTYQPKKIPWIFLRVGDFFPSSKPLAATKHRPLRGCFRLSIKALSGHPAFDLAHPLDTTLGEGEGRRIGK